MSVVAPRRQIRLSGAEEYGNYKFGISNSSTGTDAGRASWEAIGSTPKYVLDTRIPHSDPSDPLCRLRRIAGRRIASSLSKDNGEEEEDAH